MMRSAGVTVSAILVLIGSAFAIFFGLLAVLGGLIASRAALGTPADEALFIVIFEALLYLGFGGWGIVSGIGLIHLKQWARISMFVFAGLLLLVSLPAIFVMAFAPFPAPADPNLPANFMAFMRLGVVSFFLLISALAAFWIYYFNRKSVKAQFSGVHVPVSAPVSDAVSIPAHLPPSKPSGRPVSISIIAWYLLITSALSPFFLFFSHAVLPNQSMPLTFLGYFVYGRKAILITLLTAVVQISASIGLLKLQNWGRLVTIALQVLTIANVVLAFGPPANRARFQQIVQTMTASMNARMPQPVPFTYPMWIGAFAVIPLVLVILWFLVTQKKAFVKSEA